jgi:hypothetical protein
MQCISQEACYRASILGLALVWTDYCRSAAWSDYTAQPWVEDILKNIHHPDYAGLEALQLEHLTLGTSQENGNADTKVTAVADWIVPMQIKP